MTGMYGREDVLCILKAEAPKDTESLPVIALCLPADEQRPDLAGGEPCWPPPLALRPAKKREHFSQALAACKTAARCPTWTLAFSGGRCERRTLRMSTYNAVRCLRCSRMHPAPSDLLRIRPASLLGGPTQELSEASWVPSHGLQVFKSEEESKDTHKDADTSGQLDVSLNFARMSALLKSRRRFAFSGCTVQYLGLDHNLRSSAVTASEADRPAYVYTLDRYRTHQNVNLNKTASMPSRHSSRIP